MSRRARHDRTSNSPGRPPAGADAAGPGEIPDVTTRRSAWKYAVIAAVFLAWVAFLLYCGLAGGL